jgi:hypothetical protein
MRRRYHASRPYAVGKALSNVINTNASHIFGDETAQVLLVVLYTPSLVDPPTRDHVQKSCSCSCIPPLLVL